MSFELQPKAVAKLSAVWKDTDGTNSKLSSCLGESKLDCLFQHTPVVVVGNCLFLLLD